MKICRIAALSFFFMVSAFAVESTTPSPSPSPSPVASGDPTLEKKLLQRLQFESSFRATAGGSLYDFRGKPVDRFTTDSSYITLSAQISKKIRAVVTAEINQYFRQNGQPNYDNNFSSLDQFLHEAYIEVKDIGGEPIAFVVGKNAIAWGQDVERMPIYQNTPNNDLSLRNRVMGFTVKLNYKVLNFLDSVEASSFSSNVNNTWVSGKIGKLDGVSARLSGHVTEELSYEVSGIHFGNDYLGQGNDENRASLGMIYAAPDGKWTTWVEGIYLDRNATYKYAKYSVTGGISKTVGPGEVIAEISWIQNSLAQAGLGYKFTVASGLTLGPEIRYARNDPRFSEHKQDLFVGVRLQYNLKLPRKKRAL